MASGAHQNDLPVWLRPQSIALFVALMVAVRMGVAASTGFVRDEGYYTLWSFWPSAGYLDHPPMVAWLAAAGRTILGESEVAVRLFPVLSTAVTSLAVYRTGRVLFDARTAGIAVIWYNLTLAGGMLFVATPDAPVVAFWTLSVWCVAEFTRSRNANWWLLAGVFAGLALLSKYTAGFLGLGLLLYLLTSRERLGWFRLWQVWAGGALALLVFLPNLIWNVQAGWAGVGFQARRLDRFGLNLGGMLSNLGDYVGGQALAVGIFLFIFTAVGATLFFLRRQLPGREGIALPLLTSLPILLFFLAYTMRFRVEANWPIPVWPMLSLVGAWAAVHVRPPRPVLRRLLTAFRRIQAPLGAVLLGIVYAQAVWQPLSLERTVDRTSDMRGWRELEAQVAAIAEAQGAEWIIIMSGDYGLAGQLSAYARFAGDRLPIEPIRDRRRYAFMPPPDTNLLGKPALLVTYRGLSPNMLDRRFEAATRLGLVDRRQGDEVLEQFQTFLVSGPKQLAIDTLLRR